MANNPNVVPTPLPGSPGLYADGLTLEDYFAGQYVAGAIANKTGDYWLNRHSELADDAYRFASYMLNRREK